MNRCGFCGKPIEHGITCTACADARDPDLQLDRLVTACIRYPERARNLRSALSAPAPKRSVFEEVSSTFEAAIEREQHKGRPTNANEPRSEI